MTGLEPANLRHGKATLYQLSYIRMKRRPEAPNLTGGGGRNRTDVAWIMSPGWCQQPPRIIGAPGRNRTCDLNCL